jgi:hypothetical protein
MDQRLFSFLKPLQWIRRPDYLSDACLLVPWSASRAVRCSMAFSSRRLYGCYNRMQLKGETHPGSLRDHCCAREHQKLRSVMALCERCRTACRHSDCVAHKKPRVSGARWTSVASNPGCRSSPETQASPKSPAGTRPTATATARSRTRLAMQAVKPVADRRRNSRWRGGGLMPVTLDRQKIAAIRAISAMQFDEQLPRNDAC